MELRARDDETLACLRRTQLFGQLSEESLRRLSMVCVRKRVEKGAGIFMEGDRAEALYVVLCGAVTEFVSGPNDLEMAVKERMPDDYFGEIGMLIDEPHFVTATASQPTVLLVLPRNEFLARLKAEPSISQCLVKTLAHRLLRSAQHAIAYAYLDASARLAYLVLALEKDSGGSGSVEHSQEELAQRCGLARQTVARILGEWREAGWIKTGRGRIEDIDLKAMNQLLGMSRCDDHGAPAKAKAGK
ncbi:MAG: Crp/Fnr family transcriptional regulator [Spirochaetaceae bacterium]|nr:Crp/Fnr family transcriptional regulator [Spirochaetaceae bacterium]